jgi:hypothetical protein
MKKSSIKSFNLDLTDAKVNMISCNTMNYISYFSNVVFIMIALFVIYSMNQIEKSTCDCIITTKKTYIKEWFVFLIIYQLTLLILFLLSGEKCRNIFTERYIIPSLSIIILIIFIIHIIMCFRAFIYLNELRVTCKCAYNLSQKILFWYFLIIIGLFTSIVFLLIIFILYIIIFMINLKYK